jgi:hypothetical protein
LHLQRERLLPTMKPSRDPFPVVWSSALQEVTQGLAPLKGGWPVTQPLQLQLLNYLSPDPSFTPVLEQRSHTSNLPGPCGPFHPTEGNGWQVSELTKEPVIVQQRIASSLGNERNQKPCLSFLLPFSF